jgi:hypothetical protein
MAAPTAAAADAPTRPRRPARSSASAATTRTATPRTPAAVALIRAEANPDDQAFQYELILEARRRPELRPQVEQVYATYRRALRVELEAAGIEVDEALVHLVFAAVDWLVFQQVCLDDPAAARAGVGRLRALLQPLTRAGR